MKLGALRRIDNLGRVVIPKSVRKTLRIKTGDNLQIYVSDENIIIKKYSELEKINDLIRSIKKLLKKSLKSEVYITDKDKLISENPKKITEELLKIIEQRKIINIKHIKITDDIEYNGNIIVYPIIVSGDTFGSIIIISKEKLASKELSTVKTLTNLIIEMLEE